MWMRICVWKLSLQPDVQNGKGNRVKFCKRGAINGFPFFFPFLFFLLVEAIIEGDSWKYYSVYISTEVTTCIVLNFLFLSSRQFVTFF